MKLNGFQWIVDSSIEKIPDDSIIKFVNRIILEAHLQRATDIHIEPYADELKLRYRIDGILYDMPIPEPLQNFQSAIISRIKIMANLNIAEHRIPQDGRTTVKVQSEELDLRVSIMPTPFGESAVIRILSRRMLYSLEELGLSKRNFDILSHLIKRPHGILFVTGPTGSGKTTTLYACLSKLNESHRKIITIEDPIEYRLKGITQVGVNPKVGLSFSTGLRSLFRHDPDIMMVGEVRDLETAEIAIRVALTGHLVFSTLHTNDAAGGIARLLDMGIEPYLIASSVECFIAQRLVRLICTECKRVIKSDDGSLSYEGMGCPSCKWTGYRGRTAIYEFLVINDEMRSLILYRAPTEHIRKEAIKIGMRTLRQNGLDKVAMGLTDIAEVLRVS